MFTRRSIETFLGLAVFLGSLALFGCAEPPPQPIREEPAATAPQKSETPSPSAQAAEIPVLLPPSPEQVQEAVKRIFKDAVVVDSSRSPGFLTGDFNGDQSQDLAVILRPAEGKLSELNREFPNWIAREPLKDVLLSKSKMLARPGAAAAPNAAAGQIVRFEQRDVLLAIIHGEGSQGWHDPEATQTHLLRDVVGANMKTLSFKRAVKDYAGRKPFPNIYGDLIQQTLIGHSGFLHFTGGIYGWYDPETYKPLSGPAHQDLARMR
jgi:hypothetical protein